VLPSMFQFLLQEGEVRELEVKLDEARLREADALRALRLGEADRALGLATAAGKVLEQAVPLGTASAAPAVELRARLDGLGRLFDAAQAGHGERARPVLRGVLDKRLSAVDAYAKGELEEAGKRMDEAAAALAAISPTDTSAFAELWSLERRLAQVGALHQAQAWTRPMLTMREQLSLVLLLELAFGFIFELPLVIALLATLGVVRASFLIKYQRHAFVVCLIAAAIITPTGDAVNLALMAGPMLLCYELGVLAAWLIERRRNRTQATEAITPAA
jgi:sec-independent protein translocase protein TatC